MEIEALILELEEQLKLTSDFEKKLEIKDEILKLKKQIGLIKPPDSKYECEGCSA